MDVSTFWQRLSPSARRNLSRAAGLDHGRPPRAVRIVFEEPRQEHEAFDVELYEYLVNHELFAEERRVHICTAHPAARDALGRGKLAVGFQCPLFRAACPMRALLERAPGRDVRFVVRGCR